MTGEILEQEKENYTFAERLPKLKNPYPKGAPKYLQFEESYFKYSYACAGCGETPYIKLATTLFGKNMLAATSSAPSPERRIIATPPLPGGVDTAAMTEFILFMPLRILYFPRFRVLRTRIPRCRLRRLLRQRRLQLPRPQRCPWASCR